MDRWMDGNGGLLICDQHTLLPSAPENKMFLFHFVIPLTALCVAADWGVGRGVSRLLKQAAKGSMMSLN